MTIRNRALAFAPEALRKHICLILAAGASLTACGAVAQTVDQPPRLTFAFEEVVTLSPAITPGDTSLGGRNIVPITGGTFEGPGNGSGIKGTIMPGGWDWQLRRADGCSQLRADYMLKTDDGAVINVVNTGVSCPAKDGAPKPPTRTSAVFEPPLGKYEWLGKSAFVGTIAAAKIDGQSAVRIRFYKVE